MKAKKQIQEWLLITLGTLLVSAGVYFFKLPNHFSTGGVSGISVILSHYFPKLSAGDFISIINIALLVVGFLVFGKGFAIKTVYCSLLMSGFISLMERILPIPAPLTDQPLMELMYAIALPAVGSAILFNLDASSGGTDIIAMILKKYTTMDIGRALLCSDSLITLMTFPAFGVRTGLFSLLGLVMKSLLVDMVLENINTHKYFHIITEQPRIAEDYIINTLKRGATELKGEGAYTHQGRTVLITVVNRHEAVLLRRYLRVNDPTAFLLITNTGEIIGKGFRGVN